MVLQKNYTQNAGRLENLNKKTAWNAKPPKESAESMRYRWKYQVFSYHPAWVGWLYVNTYISHKNQFVSSPKKIKSPSWIQEKFSKIRIDGFEPELELSVT